MAAESGDFKGFVDRAVAVYRECAKAGSVAEARVSLLNEASKSETTELSIISKWCQRDVKRKEILFFHRSHIASFEATTKSFSNIREPSFPVEEQNLQLSSVSPSGKLQAIVRRVPGSQGQEDKQYLEIWSTGHLVKSVDVQACEKHGKIYGDSHVGCLAWSASEQSLLYVAEEKLPKAVSYLEKQTSEVPSDNPAQEEGTKLEIKDDWGEQLVSEGCFVPVVLDVISDEIIVLDGVPDHFSAGQACWGPDDSTVVFLGLFDEPHKLGAVDAMKKSVLFSLPLDGKSLEQLSDTKYAVHSPRFNHAKEKLIYIASDDRGAHCDGGRLMQYDWNTRATSTIVDVVDIPERGGFPGIYIPDNWLPERCWTADDNGVILSTIWRSSQRIILVNCDDKSVTNLTAEPGSWRLLDINNDILLAAHSTPNSLPKLMMAALQAVIPESGLSWTPVAYSYDESLEKEITWEVLSFVPSENSDYKDEYEAVFVKPVTVGDTKPSLIVFPHGGPHATYAPEFSLLIPLFCKLGFAILVVNYRGSLGFGQAALHSLPINIGTQDVQDVQRAATTVLARGEVDSSNVFVTGGSHGGFIAAHLIGQHPDFYRAAFLKNPAINYADMEEISEVHDGLYFQAGYEFRNDMAPTPQMLAEKLEKSPMSHVKKTIMERLQPGQKRPNNIYLPQLPKKKQVKTPTLIEVGEEHHAVPPSQGKNFYKVLKAQGTEVRLLWSPCIDLSSLVRVECDRILKMARWFHEHLKN